MTPAGIEPATFRFVAQHLNHCATAVPLIYIYIVRTWQKTGYVLAQLVEALCYNPKSRFFDSRLCHWNFSLTYSFRSHYDPGVDSTSNRNEYQEYFMRSKGGRCVRLTTLPPTCVECLNIWESQPPRILRDCTGIALFCFVSPHREHSVFN